MAAPSVPFTVIPLTDRDPDSPITTELITAMYENTLFNNEWMGTRANADVEHAHTGLGVDGTAPIDFTDITNFIGAFSVAAAGCGPGFSPSGRSGGSI